MHVISDRDVAKAAPPPSPTGSEQSHEQRAGWVIPGLPTMIAVVAALALGIAIVATSGKDGGVIAFGVVIISVAGTLFGGFFVVQPNEARVLVLFGRYI